MSPSSTVLDGQGRDLYSPPGEAMGLDGEPKLDKGASQKLASKGDRANASVWEDRDRFRKRLEQRLRNLSPEALSLMRLAYFPDIFKEGAWHEALIGRLVDVVRAIPKARVRELVALDGAEAVVEVCRRLVVRRQQMMFWMALKAKTIPELRQIARTLQVQPASRSSKFQLVSDICHATSRDRGLQARLQVFLEGRKVYGEAQNSESCPGLVRFELFAPHGGLPLVATVETTGPRTQELEERAFRVLFAPILRLTIQHRIAKQPLVSLRRHLQLPEIACSVFDPGISPGTASPPLSCVHMLTVVLIRRMPLAEIALLTMSTAEESSLLAAIEHLLAIYEALVRRLVRLFYGLGRPTLAMLYRRYFPEQFLHVSSTKELVRCLARPVVAVSLASAQRLLSLPEKAFIQECGALIEVSQWFWMRLGEELRKKSRAQLQDIAARLGITPVTHQGRLCFAILAAAAKDGPSRWELLRILGSSRSEVVIAPHPGL